jgi:hypothetical protein
MACGHRQKSMKRGQSWSGMTAQPNLQPAVGLVKTLRQILARCTQPCSAAGRQSGEARMRTGVSKFNSMGSFLPSFLLHIEAKIIRRRRSRGGSRKTCIGRFSPLIRSVQRCSASVALRPRAALRRRLVPLTFPSDFSYHSPDRSTSGFLQYAAVAQRFG